MRFTDKPYSFFIDDILKTSKLSGEFSLCSSTTKHSCYSNVHHSHLGTFRWDSKFLHHQRCRRTRTVFSDSQLNGLEKRFETQKYLSTPDRIELAETLHLSQLQIKTWYQNRRMKWKKQVLQDGYKEVPTKSKGRPKKNSIPSYADLQRLEHEKRMSTLTISSSCASDDEYTSQSNDDFVDIEQ